jgi:hypothetical protein
MGVFSAVAMVLSVLDVERGGGGGGIVSRRCCTATTKVRDNVALIVIDKAPFRR